MSDEKQTVRQAVKTFYADKSLSDVQMAALQKKLTEHGSVDGLTKLKSGSRAGKPGVYKWLGSVAASLLLFMLVTGYLQTPSLITSAYADIQKDANLNNGMQLSMQQWLDENDIASVPSPYPVEMSKFCRLDQILTTHIRIAGKKQGEMNVFFHHGDRPLHWSPLHWLKGAGTVDNVNWKLLKVRDNLTLIVLYSHDMHEKAVQHILHEMLPELEV